MSKPSLRFTLTVVLLVSSTAAVRLNPREPGKLSQPLASIERKIGDWVGTEYPPLDEGVLGVLRPTSYLSRTYRNAGKSIGLFIAYYAEQKAGESMHSPKNCLPGGGWQVRESGTVDVSFGGERASINKYLLRNGDSSVLVLYWYQTKNRIIASEYTGKLCLVWDSITRGYTAGSIVRLVLPDRPGALEDSISFAPKIMSSMKECLNS